jgi:predicted RNA-binding protein YlqC (UPF0109 family)
MAVTMNKSATGRIFYLSRCGKSLSSLRSLVQEIAEGKKAKVMLLF